MLVVKSYQGDQDTILDLGDGREVRIAFMGAKRMAEGRIQGSIGVHAPQSVKILFPNRKKQDDVRED